MDFCVVKFYKIPLGSDLSQTMFRAQTATAEHIYIEYNGGHIGEDWEEITEAVVREEAPYLFGPPEVPPTLSDSEAAIYDTQANVEYLVCLSELGL